MELVQILVSSLHWQGLVGIVHLGTGYLYSTNDTVIWFIKKWLPIKSDGVLRSPTT